MAYALISSRRIFNDTVYTVMNLKNNRLEYYSYINLLYLCLSECFINLSYNKTSSSLEGLYCNFSDYLSSGNYFTCIKVRPDAYTFVDRLGRVHVYNVERVKSSNNETILEKPKRGRRKKCEITDDSLEIISNEKDCPLLDKHKGVKESYYYKYCLNKDFIENSNHISTNMISHSLSSTSFELQSCYLSFLTEDEGDDDGYESIRVLDSSNLILLCDSLYDKNLNISLPLNKICDLYKIESLSDLSLSLSSDLHILLLDNNGLDNKRNLFDLNLNTEDYNEILDSISHSYHDLDFYDSDIVPGVCVTGLDLSSSVLNSLVSFM